ncbi:MULTISPECIES: ATP-binding protein [unclassified Providencia]|uniref:ATP-binding protein n=1 Tax=unclassified Providencia TaxID=2633465 RepID=UPI001C5B9CDC|nr:ATP-binding protein [Providencia sp. R33]QXX81617.1 ATP-binding protein [Providencia sp. R33]
MNNIIIDRLSIDTGVSSTFLEEALTKDITTLEAIFDLVDNSIDAARDLLIEQKCSRGDDNLPSSYSGFYICIRIDEDSLRVLDNCSGIDRDTLSTRTLYTNKPSEHEYGIGLYGIGLKRSMLKMGTEFSFYVDNGIEGFKSHFNNKAIGGGKDSPVYADVVPTKLRKKSLFNVSNIKSEIKNDFHNSKWFDNAIKEFSNRYSIYIKKGLKIVLHHVKNKVRKNIEGVSPSLKLDGKFLPTKKCLYIQGVDVIIESGIHSEYIFPGEEGHSIANNKKLTDSFGIYFSCNDRVIVAASTEKVHGWATKWHSEYNGYVCWVKFISKNAGLLPWNTAKSALRTDSALFLEVREQLQPIADQYRSAIKQRYLSKSKNNFQNVEEADNKIDNKSTKNEKVEKSEEKIPSKNISSKKDKIKARPNVDLPRNRDILVDWGVTDIIIPEKRNKEYHIFYELCQLKSKDEPITCVVMLRVFLETTTKEVMKCINSKPQNSLAKNSAYIASVLNERKYITEAVKLLIERYGRTNEDSLLSINNIQSLVHSVDFNTEKTLVNRYWDDLKPFLEGCWKLINDYDIK